MAYDGCDTHDWDGKDSHRIRAQIVREGHACIHASLTECGQAVELPTTVRHRGWMLGHQLHNLPPRVLPLLHGKLEAGVRSDTSLACSLPQYQQSKKTAGLGEGLRACQGDSEAIEDLGRIRPGNHAKAPPTIH